MKNSWETHSDRILRYMKMDPLKKMEWLAQMQEFSWKASDKKTREIRLKLKAARSLAWPLEN